MSSRFQVIEGGGQSTGPTLERSKEVAQSVLGRLVDRSGIVQSRSIMHVHEVLTRELGLPLVDKNTFGVLPGGFQLFYALDGVLVRVKTTGTERRRKPHMTISLSERGSGWDDESAKFNLHGGLTPKLLAEGPGPGRVSRMSVFQTGLTGAQQDTWANRCHFDFPDGFSDAGAAGLTPDS